MAVDLGEHGATETPRNERALFVDESVKVLWYARRISDILPNPLQAACIVQELMPRMYHANQDDSKIYRQRPARASQLREHVAKAMDQQAEKAFRAKLSAGEIRFDLEASDHNHRMRKSYGILVADGDVLLQRYGQSVQLAFSSPCSTGPSMTWREDLPSTSRRAGRLGGRKGRRTRAGTKPPELQRRFRFLEPEVVDSFWRRLWVKSPQVTDCRRG